MPSASCTIFEASWPQERFGYLRVWFEQDMIDRDCMAVIWKPLILKSPQGRVRAKPSQLLPSQRQSCWTLGLKSWHRDQVTTSGCTMLWNFLTGVYFFKRWSFHSSFHHTAKNEACKPYTVHPSLEGNLDELGDNHKKTEPIQLCLRPFLDLVEVCVEVSKAVHSCLDLCQTRAIPQLIFLATKKKNVPFCLTGLLMLDSTVDNGLRYLSGFWSQLSNPQQNGVKVKPFTRQELEGLCMPEDYPGIIFCLR